MKDIHGERSSPGRIPVISPILHCVAMTALVFLRSSFGLTLFRPRTIFSALSVAVAVLDYIAWHEPEIWREYRAACIFTGSATALYWLHFGIALVRELNETGSPDAYAGTSHVLRVARIFGPISARTERSIHIWIEPAAVLAFAMMLQFAFGERHLSGWLVAVALCIFFAEALNHWTALRRRKFDKDVVRDVEERGDALDGRKKTSEAPIATRVAAQKIRRNPAASEEEARTRRFAEILGISKPFDLEEAEANYRSRLQLCHLDSHENSAENHPDAAELNKAIAFFREKLS